ncbi:MAG: hypothetical protein Q9M36_07145 [Sulfurovum sp.]|nr:hypothetical protein [Sulfurovum sp.]
MKRGSYRTITGSSFKDKLGRNQLMFIKTHLTKKGSIYLCG